jgi:hypothetical protein
MEVVKKTKEHTIYKKRSGRLCVVDANQKWVNGADKLALITKEGLSKVPKAKKKEEAPAAETPEA